MSRHDWYRNTTWDESIERAFGEKLRRARDKQQYLLIQASTLAASDPEVALGLLTRYFELPGKFHHASAHETRARACLALGRITEAIVSYEAALAREAEFPGLQTTAGLDLPYLVAAHGLRVHYPRALKLLRVRESGLMFPVQRFQWHAAHALIARDSGQPADARSHAAHATEAAAASHSGFRYHPSVGLVSEAYDGMLATLRALAIS